MRRYQRGRPFHALHQQTVLARVGQQRLVPADSRVDPDPIPVRERVAHEVAVAHHVDPLGRQVRAPQVKVVVGGPQFAGLRVDIQPHGIAHAAGEDAPTRAVGIELENGVPRVALRDARVRVAIAQHRFFQPAQIARRTHRQIELAALLVKGDGPRRVPAFRGNLGHHFPLLVHQVAVRVPVANHPVCLGRVQIPAIKGDVIGPREPAGHLDGHVGHTVVVAIGQRQNARSVRHVQHSVGAERQHARPSRTAGDREDTGRKARGQVEDRVGRHLSRELVGHLHLHRLKLQVHLRSQLESTRRIVVLSVQRIPEYRGEKTNGNEDVVERNHRCSWEKGK